MSFKRRWRRRHCACVISPSPSFYSTVQKKEGLDRMWMYIKKNATIFTLAAASRNAKKVGVQISSTPPKQNRWQFICAIGVVLYFKEAISRCFILLSKGAREAAAFSALECDKKECWRRKLKWIIMCPNRPPESLSSHISFEEYYNWCSATVISNKCNTRCNAEDSLKRIFQCR